VLIHIDGAGSTHAVVDRLTAQRLSYSVGSDQQQQRAVLVQRPLAHQRLHTICSTAGATGRAPDTHGWVGVVFVQMRALLIGGDPGRSGNTTNAP